MIQQSSGYEPELSASDRQRHIETLRDIIRDFRIAMLTTVDGDGSLHTRPMGTIEADFDGDVWFFTDERSSKVSEIAREQQVSVAYADTGRNRYAVISGSAELVNDRAKMEQLWTPILKAWFPDGLDTPELALLHVRAERGEYWDGDGRIVAALKLAAAAVTGKPTDMGDNHQVDLK